ncbi:hypothetical protein QVN60_11940 [Yersinia aleksiciae]|uniref:hypothetical protein n=1 Tax=Yersinia aleksiciae TaxID=263819 RepID=UPI0025AB1033|nr:hypothetical protein [Yersinia aleksiciae]MDN0123895.1 hypothetical protein [Yersinia aleksiciae]
MEEENLAGQAIQDFLDREAWQIAEIKQAIIEAEQQDFISENEMNSLFKRMGMVVQGKNK